MPGGASTRSFFRLHTDQHQAVLMLTPPPDPWVTGARQARGIAPFLEVAELLRCQSVSVPKIYHSSHRFQAILVEDLGDLTLERYVRDHPERKEAIYTKIVRDLAEAATRLGQIPVDSCVRERSFDTALLRWELDHFVDWALIAQGYELSGSERALFDEAASFLSAEIASWPTSFVHRDFQSRNLMVRLDGAGSERVFWIDFQDAMLGCRTYDLVALLTDSYQNFDPSFVSNLLEEYSRVRGLSIAEVRREFDFVTVQRKLKDAGRFVYFDKMQQNPTYLPFVAPTLGTVAQALNRLQDCKPLTGLPRLLEKLL